MIDTQWIAQQPKFRRFARLMAELAAQADEKEQASLMQKSSDEDEDEA